MFNTFYILFALGGGGGQHSKVKKVFLYLDAEHYVTGASKAEKKTQQNASLKGWYVCSNCMHNNLYGQIPDTLFPTTHQNY